MTKLDQVESHSSSTNGDVVLQDGSMHVKGLSM